MSNTNTKGSAKPQQRTDKGHSKSEVTARKTSRSKRHDTGQDITSGEHADNGDKSLVNGASKPQMIMVHDEAGILIFIPHSMRLKITDAGCFSLSGEDMDKLGKLISI